MLIDSHAHLDMEAFDRDRVPVLKRALEGGISHIITIGIDLSSSHKAIELSKNHGLVFSTIGYHPHNASEMDSSNLKKLEELTTEPKVVGWGEIGLDFVRRLSPPERQIEAFETQLEVAYRHDLPVIIHDREAHKEILTILQQRGEKRPIGVIHCFSGDYDLAMKFIEMGLFISIPGTVTYKNASQVQEVASRVPLDRMLLETDAPFLAPVPKRGKRNEPLFVAYTAQKIAQLRGMDFEEVARRTSENAKGLFKLPDVNNTGLKIPALNLL